MSGPQEPTPSLQSPTLWLNARLVPDFTWDASQPTTVEFSQQAITELQQVLRTAPTLELNRVSVRFTLKLTQSHTRQGMESLSRELNFLRRTAPAIHARVCSLMRAYLPWCLLENIETNLDYVYWQT